MSLSVLRAKRFAIGESSSTANSMRIGLFPATAANVRSRRSVPEPAYRSLSYHIYESSIEIARRLSQTRGYRISQRMRKRVEELFGEAKECMGMRRMRFRGALFVREQVLLTATATNIKRMVRLLSQTRTEKRGQRRKLLRFRSTVAHCCVMLFSDGFYPLINTFEPALS